MKIHSDALTQAIWTLQLKQLSSDVLQRYVGDKYGLVPNDDTWYKNASDIHLCERQKITDKLGKQQILKRVRKLIDEKYIAWAHQNLTFFIDTKQARKAFVVARDFWLSKGIPEGFGDKGMRCVSLDNHQHLVNECFEHLQEQFRSVDWIELTDIAFADK